MARPLWQWGVATWLTVCLAHYCWLWEELQRARSAISACEEAQRVHAHELTQAFVDQHLAFKEFCVTAIKGTPWVKSIPQVFLDGFCLCPPVEVTDEFKDLIRAELLQRPQPPCVCPRDNVVAFGERIPDVQFNWVSSPPSPP